MSEQSPQTAASYRVLARKYRPQNFDELIGQDALVRTLTNAIESGRIAHAFMLTGVRGVGKTTTARIIAKALNYKGPDGKSGPTTGSTDDCSLCRAIAEDRHPDVIEMDAASRTGVDDIREILDGVRYAPTEARYKIYIIDEVHMLSKNAFNALLKTLEEPPPHVKFIFATTEIRKVPITVLSRCQRFDLRRVDVPTLIAHFKDICTAEKVQADEESLALMARAADGSVRDGLSLLDRVIALAGSDITGAQVKSMLGLGDRARTLDLLEHALTGNMPEALSIMDELYRAGGDPLVLIQDLLEITHILTRLRAVPATQDMKHAMAADAVARAAEMAAKLSMPTLGKSWQILLKGLAEVQTAPVPQAAAEMVIIRLAYAADLPDPADLLKKLKDGTVVSAGAPAASSSPARESAPVAMRTIAGGGNTAAAIAPQPVSQPISTPATSADRAVATLEDVVAILDDAREIILSTQVYQYVHLVKLEAGRLEIRIEPQANPKLAQELGAKLSTLTGQRWMVSVSGAPGAATLAERANAEKNKEFAEVLEMPVIREILEVFPQAKLAAILKE